MKRSTYIHTDFYQTLTLEFAQKSERITEFHRRKEELEKLNLQTKPNKRSQRERERSEKKR